MATRPTIVLDIRASNGTWDGTAPIPLQGQPNKTPPPIPAKIANGWNGDEKPGAQEFNFYDNRNDQWVFWVTEGSALALLAPHIKEADGLGNTAFASLVAGGTPLDAEPINVSPNFGTGETGLFCVDAVGKPGAIFQTITNGTAAGIFRHNGTSPAGTDVGVLRVESPSSGPTAIIVEVDSFEHAIIVTNTEAVGACVAAFAGPGNASVVVDGGPAFFGNVGVPDGARVGGLAGHFRNEQSSGDTVLIESTDAGANGDALVITGENRSICIKANQLGGKRPAARFEAVLDGSDGSAPLQLVPQVHDISGEAVSTGEGSVWIQRGTFASDTQDHPRFFSGASAQKPKWLGWTNGPTCAITTYLVGTLDTEDDDLFKRIFLSSFPTDNIPIDTGKVIITIKGRVLRSATNVVVNAKDGVNFRVTDETAAPGVSIFNSDYDLVVQDTGQIENTLETTFEMEFEYTLPAAGQRTFAAEFKRSGGGTPSGALRVNNPIFMVRPKP